MNPVEYLEAVKERLLTDPIVLGFQIRRERITLADGHLRVRASLSDGSFLEFTEYVERAPKGQVQVVTYSYHWANAAGGLIQRWDNTPHFPDLPGFPHHIHDGASGEVAPGQPLDIFAVLETISQTLAV